jgi:hypothetical protein
MIGAKFGSAESVSKFAANRRFIRSFQSARFGSGSVMSIRRGRKRASPGNGSAFSPRWSQTTNV